MRILYLSQYFPPESGATQIRAFELARAMVAQGHQVTMLTEFPNHPSGIMPQEYRRRILERTDLNGIDVIRVWVKTTPNKTFSSRLWLYLSYMINAALAGLFLTRGRYDLVYCSSPPLFTGAAGLALSAIKRLPFFFEVRDLWPESAVVLGELNNPRWISWAQRLEEACYRQAQKIIVVTQGISTRLRERGISADKLVFIPNGVNPDEFHFSAEGRANIRAQLGWEHRFIAIYAGIFGIAQGLETILKAAELLRDNPDVAFLLVGEGPRKEEISALAKEMTLPNLCLFPGQPYRNMADFLSAADIALVPLRQVELFQGALPSKIFDAWSCRRPVLVSINGEARQLVEQAQGGIFTPPEDHQMLAETLLSLSKNPAGVKNMGENGHAFAQANYSRAELADRLIRILQESLASQT